MKDRQAGFQVDGLDVVSLAPVSTADRYIVRLGLDSDGAVLVEIPWQDIVEREGGLEAFRDDRIRAALADPERVVEYPPGEGPVIRKEPVDG